MPSTEAFDLNSHRMQTLRKRLLAEARFRFLGLTAISFVAAMLILLLATIVLHSVSAFQSYKLVVPLQVQEASTEQTLSQVHASMLDGFGEIDVDRDAHLPIRELVSGLAVERSQAGGASRTSQSSGGAEVFARIPVISAADSYLKGQIEFVERFSLSRASFSDQLLDLSIEDRGLLIEQTSSEFSDQEGDTFYSMSPEGLSVLVFTTTTVLRITSISNEKVSGDVLLNWDLPSDVSPFALVIARPESKRLLKDIQIAALESLRSDGKLEKSFNTALFTSSDSNDPELAGVVAALTGSLFIIGLVGALALPLGIASALYLEELASDSRLKRIVTVNINNLAAVPNIIYGLLGAAILINGVSIPIPFSDTIVVVIGGGFGRGWPIVGGIVMAIAVLPTIIITSRAAIAAFPQKRREATLALGATRLQLVRDHILPQSLPGMMTGAIIGLAQTFGETAPLLLIGMFAFIGDPAQDIGDRTNTLPVLIYQWSTRADLAWEPLTAAAIIVLLSFMLLMNAGGVWLRMRYEGKR